MTPDSYVAAVDAALRQQADPARAPAMRAYLLDQFDFLGIPAPIRRKAIQAHRFSDAADVLDAAQRLWAKPEREFRYTAIDLLARNVKLLDGSHLPALQALLQRDAWWDTVDGLSSVMGDIIQAHRLSAECDKWIAHRDFWVRRSAMLHQLGWRMETDTGRLFAYAERLAAEKEFFIRKAIGWALRDYARWNPAAVQAFIDTNRDKLSKLTIREACKHLDGKTPR